MHVHSPNFQGQLVEKNWTENFIVWMLGKVYACNTCFYIQFLRAFIVFISVDLVTKKLLAFLHFLYTDRTFNRPVPLCIQIFLKILFYF